MPTQRALGFAVVLIDRPLRQFRTAFSASCTVPKILPFRSHMLDSAAKNTQPARSCTTMPTKPFGDWITQRSSNRDDAMRTLRARRLMMNFPSIINILYTLLFLNVTPKSQLAFGFFKEHNQYMYECVKMYPKIHKDPMVSFDRLLISADNPTAAQAGFYLARHHV